MSLLIQKNQIWVDNVSAIVNQLNKTNTGYRYLECHTQH